jgi:hypothetical protein
MPMRMETTGVTLVDKGFIITERKCIRRMKVSVLPAMGS